MKPHKRQLQRPRHQDGGWPGDNAATSDSNRCRLFYTPGSSINIAQNSPSTTTFSSWKLSTNADSRIRHSTRSIQNRSHPAEDEKPSKEETTTSQNRVLNSVSPAITSEEDYFERKDEEASNKRNYRIYQPYPVIHRSRAERSDQDILRGDPPIFSSRNSNY